MGADTAAAGSTLIVPTCTVPIDSWVDWLPGWL
jgi:hypothetical protein